MTFLYGNNVTKAGLARITDGIPQYGGVIVYRYTILHVSLLIYLSTNSLVNLFNHPLTYSFFHSFIFSLAILFYYSLPRCIACQTFHWDLELLRNQQNIVVI